ncbi:hypothetical protein KFE25_008912 [Diacronema lutheri]|uniref:Right handed beta helix domain-containing protein n=1 Tax=Diacronema lutheri TaxID=2081491 RepID=A0A8J5XWT1_DIALT|nr:hypothetical protein KFE25_008912 [Diacronema lutheri]
MVGLLVFIPAASAQAPLLDGMRLLDAGPSTHVVLVEETGYHIDTPVGECVEHSAPSGVVHALLSCTLHAAFRYCNALPRGQSGLIVLAPGRYHLETPLPAIAHALTLVGADAHFGSAPPVVLETRVEGGSAKADVRTPSAALPLVELATIDGMHEHRVLEIAPDVDVLVQHLAIANGHGDRGGGIKVLAGSGLVRLIDVHITSCTAVYGGALYSEARVDLRHSSMHANDASRCGGAIYTTARTLSADRSDFHNNRDACTRDKEVEILEAIKAEGTAMNVIVVGSAVALAPDVWVAEDSRMRDERRETKRMHADWLANGRPTGVRRYARGL